MFITIQLILTICINVAHASLHVTYGIRNAKPGVKSYFNAATKFTSNSFVGAQCKVRRQLTCEPLTFDWFSKEDYKDDLVYLMKTCVVETFGEKVTLFCLCLVRCDYVPFSHTDWVLFWQINKYSSSIFCDQNVFTFYFKFCSGGNVLRIPVMRKYSYVFWFQRKTILLKTSGQKMCLFIIHIYL